MSFPSDNHRASGLSWLHELPKHWSACKLRYAARLQGGYAFPASGFDSEGTTVVRMNNLKRGKLDLDEAAKIPASSCVEKVALVEGDLLWGMSGSVGDTGSLGNYARVRSEDLPCQLNQRVGRFVVNEELLSLDYLQQTIQTDYFYEQVLLSATGTAQFNVSSEQVEACLVALPPLDEQKAISSFLAVETSKIDGLVSEQRRLIELLKEKRQAVISHAVTKGLNPNAPMKPSGIQWLGDVPQHWSTTILKRLVVDRRPITYGIVQPGEPDSNGRFMIRGGDYSNGWCEADEVFRVSDAIEIPYTRSRMKTGDLIITIVGAGVGNIAVVPDWLDGANITQTSARIALNPEKANAEFVCLALQGIIGQKNLDLNVYGAAQPRLNIAHIDVYVMTVPPLEEQQEIADFIKDKVDRFGALEAEAERAIDLLQERRTALISAAVTGKIDVRGVIESAAP